MSSLPAFSIRIALLVCGLFCAIFAAPWLTLGIMLVMAICLGPIEVVILGLFVDFLWLPASLHDVPLFTLAAIALAWGFEPLRREFLTERSLL